MMRVSLNFLFAAGAIAATIATPVASEPGVSHSRLLNDQQLLQIYRDKLKPLRAEILARKAAEGGELSESSRAEFQARLDKINQEFRRFVKKQDMFGYDAWGHRDG